MTEVTRTSPYTLGSDDKVANIMVYGASQMLWGEVVVKQMIRVSTWLRTNTAPDRVCIYNAKVMSALASTPSRPLQFSELHIAATQVLAYHLTPPAKDPPDYDPSEPNRRMQPVSVLIGPFRVDGNLRLATKSSVAKFLEVARETYTAIYDAQITNPNMPALGVISVPFLLVRQEISIFTQV